MTKSKTARDVALAIVFCESTHRMLMVTSRKHPHLWILPKGGVEKGETSGAAAVRESHEEAGTPLTLGIPAESDKLATIDLPESKHQKRAAVWHVHAVKADEEGLLPDWLEKHERKREWVSPKEAISRIQAWYTDSNARDEVDVDVDVESGEVEDEARGEEKEKGHEKGSKKGAKKREKGGAMERAVQAFVDVYGWGPEGEL